MFKLLEPFTTVASYQKVVMYAGKNLIVPAWTKYITMDENGDVYCYSLKPQLIPQLNHEMPATAKVGYWTAVDVRCNVEFLQNYTYEGDWKESLQEVD